MYSVLSHSLSLLQTLKPPQGREPPKAVSIFPSLWALGGREGQGWKVETLLFLTPTHCCGPGFGDSPSEQPFQKHVL